MAAAVAGLGAGGLVLARRRGHPPVIETGRGQYNVLFVLTDQERSWDRLPAGFIETHCPGRARLASQSVRFPYARVASQLCSMARGIIYSGRHSQTNGVWENVPIPIADELRRDIPNMGSLFRDAGYAVGYTGKWHLSKIEAMKRGNAVRDEIRSYGFIDSDVTEETDGANVGAARDAATVDAALRFVNQHKGARQPWFLAVNILNPHDVMYYTSGDEMTRSRRIEFPDRSVRPPDTPFYQQDLGYDIFGRWGPSTRAGRPFAIQEYARAMEANLGLLDFGDQAVARDFQNYYLNCIRDSDRHLVRLLDGIEQSGEADRTIIVFTSDHGELLGVHGLRGKGVGMVREASEVPFLVKHPDIAAGDREAMVSQPDILPTLAGLAGLDTQRIREQVPQLAGYDLSATIAGSGPSERDRRGVLHHWTSMAFIDHLSGVKFKPVFEAQGFAKLPALLEAMPQLALDNRGHMRGWSDDRWAFARYFAPHAHNRPTDWETLSRANDLELYDRAADPDETVNLAYRPEYRSVVMQASANTEQLIAAEIGDDRGAFLPLITKL